MKEMSVTEGPRGRHRARAERAAVDKFERRRGEIADSALVTLAANGYANTGLRDIAQNSAFSHGVVHYYFSDKLDLMQHCIRQYKQDCVKQYDGILESAATAAELREGFAAAMAATLSEESTLHRMWYDLRNQSMFTTELVGVIKEIDLLLEQMIWRVVTRYAELAESAPLVEPTVAYSLYDGLFLRSLIDFLAGDREALVFLQRECAALLPRLCP